MLKYKPYSIRTPQWSTTSGGIRVMFGLYGHLLAKGQIAFLNAIFEDKDFIGVYPEIFSGNELQANTVVRYILNKPGVMWDGVSQSPTSFPKSDIKYVFSRLFDDEVDDKHLMFLPILNIHLFKNTHKQRAHKCVYVGKGQDLGKHPIDCIYIDKNLSSDQYQLADFLNRCEVMYAYDPVSAMYEIARLCGCRIVLFNPTYTKEEFSKYEPGMDGISWGEDEGVEINPDKFMDKYKQLVTSFGKRLDEFIEETQNIRSSGT